MAPHTSSTDSLITDAARAILSAPPALFRTLEQNLSAHKVEAEWFVEFAGEVCCYILHLLDRSLWDIAPQSRRDELMDKLLFAICREHRVILDDIGFEVTDDQVVGMFGDMYSTRQLEYGALRKGWFEQVTLRFGRHAADALEVPEQAWSEVALKSSLLVPALYKDLLSSMKPLLKAAAKCK